LKRILVILTAAILVAVFCAYAAPVSADETTGAASTDATPASTEETDGAVFMDGDPTPTPEPTPEPDYISCTTGLHYSKDVGYHPINIQIENSTGARPQSGMSQADIVYECLMEHMSMTRFQCVFNDNLPTTVGPVRSCRIPFVDIAMEYKGILACYGGPTSGLASILPKINEAVSNHDLILAANGLKGYFKYYWRSTSRGAPHNVYTNLAKMKSDLYDNKYIEPVSHFLFGTDADYSKDRSITSIEIQYDTKSFDVKYTYDPAAVNYKRYVGGKSFTDASTRKQITVKNIIVQYARTFLLGTSKGHINIDRVGSGVAEVYVGGKQIQAIWVRPTESDITRFYDKAGNEIQLLPGNTWVQEIPDTWVPKVSDAKVVYYKK
jgi:hypothetical protein